MTEHAIVVEGKNSFFIASRAELVDFPGVGNREMAWAEKHIVPNKMHRYVLGKFVEANHANHNKQFWALDQLRLAQPTIQNSPMNLLHNPRHIVGAFLATEMMYPLGEEASAETNPYIESLGVFWKWYFPQESAVIESAHALGQLFYSMECISDSITCAGDDGCGLEFQYAGPKSTTYCAHLNAGESVKQLNNPFFLGGALIIPPEKPGWSGAAVTDLSALVSEHRLESELAYEGFRAESPHLGSEHWQYLMEVLLATAKGHPELAAKRHKAGAKVHLSKAMGHMSAGARGVVQSAHNGPYYGVGFGGPVYFVPQDHVEPDADDLPAVPPGIASYEPSVVVKARVEATVEQIKNLP